MKKELIPDAELLADMQKDLHDFILEWGKKRELDMSKFSVTTRDNKRHNTLFTGYKMFDREFKVFINLDKSYSRQDVCNLACKIVRMFESNMKKDATNLAIFTKTFQKDGNDPLTAQKLAIKELKRMK